MIHWPPRSPAPVLPRTRPAHPTSGRAGPGGVGSERAGEARARERAPAREPAGRGGNAR
jgi:hypothetical protein